MENKVTESTLVEYIIKEIEGFDIFLEKEKKYWGGKIPEGLDSAEFVSFVYNELTKNPRNEELLKRCFEVVEKLLEIGDEKVKNYVYFMFIESLTNQLGNDGYDENIVRPYMSPRSLRALDRINDFWMKGKIIESLD